MEQPSKRPALRPNAPRLTRAQRKRRRRLRLIRNWSILILVCAALVALMAKGILWLLPKVNALLAGPKAFEAAEYDGTAYTFNPADERPIPRNRPRSWSWPMTTAASGWKRKRRRLTAAWRQPRRPTECSWC